MSSANQGFFFFSGGNELSAPIPNIPNFFSLSFFFKQCCIKLPDIIAKHYISGNGLIACTAF